jgi:glycosyltransferase involved in cell wall biosynthesis
MADILTIATAGLKPGQLQDVSHEIYPRVDYLELRTALPVDIVNYDRYYNSRFGNFLRVLETLVRSDLYLSLLSLSQKRHYRLLFAMSERAGIPVAALNDLLPDRKLMVSMFQSWSYRQEYAVTRLKLFKAIDSVLVHCQSLRLHMLTLGADPERVHVVPYGIDHRFFRPLPDVKPKPGFILSLGEVRSRDYQTLFRAVDGLPVELRVLAAGMWFAREKNRRLPSGVPNNTAVANSVSHRELRDLYAQSEFVVLPVYDLVYSAGATAALEAMSMGRPVICSRSRGIQEYVIDGETGLMVKPGDPKELREAITFLLSHPKERLRMGQNARQFVEEKYNLVNYLAAIKANLLRTLDGATG